MNDKIEQIMNLFERVRAYGYGYEAEETLSEIRAALESLAGGEAVIQFRHPQWPNKEQWHDCNEKELAKLRLFGMEFRTLYTTPPATVPLSEHEKVKAELADALARLAQYEGAEVVARELEYCINNPSAWEAFSQEGSDMVERLVYALIPKPDVEK